MEAVSSCTTISHLYMENRHPSELERQKGKCSWQLSVYVDGLYTLDAEIYEEFAQNTRGLEGHSPGYSEDNMRRLPSTCQRYGTDHHYYTLNLFTLVTRRSLGVYHFWLRLSAVG